MVVPAGSWVRGYVASNPQIACYHMVNKNENSAIPLLTKLLLLVLLDLKSII